MRPFAPVLVVLLLIGASAMTASAQPYRARQGVQSGEVRSLDEILNGIRRERPGSLADVEGPNMGPYGEPRYRLKWLTPDGRVLWLDTDARTGRVLGVQGDDRAGIPGPPRGRFGGPRFAPGGERGPVAGADRSAPPDRLRGGRFGQGGQPGVVPGGRPSGPPPAYRGPGRFGGAGGFRRGGEFPGRAVPGGRFGGGGRFRNGR